LAGPNSRRGLNAMSWSWVALTGMPDAWFDVKSPGLRERYGPAVLLGYPPKKGVILWKSEGLLLQLGIVRNAALDCSFRCDQRLAVPAFRTLPSAFLPRCCAGVDTEGIRCGPHVVPVKACNCGTCDVNFGASIWN
jgi:hypothetical protein